MSASTQKLAILEHMRKRGDVSALNSERAWLARYSNGTIVGSFVVLRPFKRRGRIDYLVRCFCGTEKVMQKASVRKSKSCGCLTGSLLSKARTRHGATDTPTWKSWKSMLERCESRAHKSFKDYGGRGIAVCGSWRVYENFVSDMGVRPSGMQLDRVDNNRNYEPGNCRWATPKQNANNRRSSRFVEHNGERRTVSQWACTVGIGRDTLIGRLDKGWSAADALTISVRVQKNNRQSANARQF
jgi:hypothetical protein